MQAALQQQMQLCFLPTQPFKMPLLTLLCHKGHQLPPARHSVRCELSEKMHAKPATSEPFYAPALASGLQLGIAYAKLYAFGQSHLRHYAK